MSESPDLSLLAVILRVGPNTPYAKLLDIARGAVAKAEEADLAIPREVYDALMDWTGAEPSQSVLALAMDEWRARQQPPR